MERRVLEGKQLLLEAKGLEPPVFLFIRSISFDFFGGRETTALLLLFFNFKFRISCLVFETE
jgi:hypothetical protein